MPYNGKNIILAKNLRKNMTPWERKLWYEFLRNYPFRFYRQKVIGEYIVDFCCSKAKLIVELDGSGHFSEQQKAKDIIRTQYLENLGYKLMRISNYDVDTNFYGVCETIDKIIKQKINAE